MAENNKEMTPEEVLRRATLHYIGVGALWLALIFSGIALERLGLTVGLLVGVLPGEVQALRQQFSEEQHNLSTLTSERDQLKVRLDRLREARESYTQCNAKLQQLKETLQQASAPQE